MDDRIGVKLDEQREIKFKNYGIDKYGLELLEDYDHDKGPTSTKTQSFGSIKELAQEFDDRHSSRDDESVLFSDSSDEQDSQSPADKKQPKRIVKIKFLPDK